MVRGVTFSCDTSTHTSISSTSICLYLVFDTLRLITRTDVEAYIPSVCEEIVAIVQSTTLTARQYAVILNPTDTHGTSQPGCRRLVRGPASFMLAPGETLERGVQDACCLAADCGLVLRAAAAFEDTDSDGATTLRAPGERWLVRGPAVYVPPVDAEVLAVRCAVPLEDSAGVYVRNVCSGAVRVVSAETVAASTYMLTANEELWEKPLPFAVEALLQAAMPNPAAARDPTRVVTFSVPHNCATQVFDSKEQRARVVFGPALAALGQCAVYSMMPVCVCSLIVVKLCCSQVDT